ncbi:MAG: ATP-binding protein [bacterium]
MKKAWPGGLRAQALLGFSIIIAVTFGLLGLVMDQIFETRLRQSHIARVEAFALAYAELARDSAPWPADVSDVQRIEIDAGSVVWQDDVLVAEFAGKPGLRVVAGKTFRAEREATRRWVVTFLVAEALVLLAFVYGLFTFLVVRPLRAIGVATERASAGDLASPIMVLPGNEFGRVGTSFNIMLGRLDESRLELERRLDALQRANAQIASAQASLIRSEKLASVGQLSAGIAHEIGNPLAAISGFNEIMLDGDLDEDDRRDLLERTQAQLHRIRAIIRKLLDFSRDDRPKIEATSLRKCVDEALALAMAIPTSRSVTIRCESDDVLVCASPGELLQVLLNLFMNAFDALAQTPQPCVEVSWELTPESLVELTVCDNGPGISAEVREQIFEPFFTTKDPGEGTGLGLAIASRILEQFGGSIRLEAGAAGAVFVLTLKPWENA